MKEIVYKIIYGLVWYWVWQNEMYRRSYWMYVTGQDWMWMHLLHNPNEGTV